MGYLHLVEKEYPQTYSKSEALHILKRYKSELTTDDYETILNSLCSHALESMYLNEKDIIVSIAHLRKEISLDEIVEMVKAS